MKHTNTYRIKKKKTKVPTLPYFNSFMLIKTKIYLKKNNNIALIYEFKAE